MPMTIFAMFVLSFQSPIINGPKSLHCKRSTSKVPRLSSKPPRGCALFHLFQPFHHCAQFERAAPRLILPACHDCHSGGKISHPKKVTHSFVIEEAENAS